MEKYGIGDQGISKRERQRQRQRDTERDKQTSTTIVKVHKKEYDRKQISVRSYKMIVAN